MKLTGPESQKNITCSTGEASVFSRAYLHILRAMLMRFSRHRFGADDVEVYLFEFTTLEVAAAHRHKHPNAVTDPLDADMPPNSLAKLVCRRSQDERVVGFHFVGGAAGEMTQVRVYEA